MSARQQPRKIWHQIDRAEVGWLEVTDRTSIQWPGSYDKLLDFVDELIKQRKHYKDAASLTDLTLAILTLQTWVKINMDYEREGKHISEWFLRLVRARLITHDQNMPLVEYMTLHAMLDEEEEQARVGTNTKKIVLAVEEALEMLRDGTAHTNRDAGIALAPKYGLSAHYIETKIGEARQDGKSTKRGRPRKS